MHKILAISGGVDSVSMLHIMRHDPTVIVAHFNHGIRENSDADEAFVQELAKIYQLPFVSKKENLGWNCSESHARERRYGFLKEVCQKHHGKIYTAHHQDDLIETIAINILRGTGWRGLIPFGNTEIHRPLVNTTKNDIRQYAAQHNLIFRHDASNTDDQYLRNRLRCQLDKLSSEQKHRLIHLYYQQKSLKSSVVQALQDILPNDNIYQRNWFINLDDAVAIEILRAGLAKVNHTATRPQLVDFLSAIRSYGTNKKFNLGNGYLVTMGRKNFQIML